MTFQSAPCTEVQGDIIGDCHRLISLGNVSIRSLHRSTGRFRLSAITSSAPEGVSIRSLHRSTGRSVRHIRVKVSMRPITGSFNPLPAPKYREIFIGSTAGKGAVSIRSLHRSTGRLQDGLLVRLKYPVSIRSLHRSTGRSQTGSGPSVRFGFNPLPAPKYREILPEYAIKRVSIRSLHRSTGRSPRPRHKFHCLNTVGFNPLPAPKYREIKMIWTVCVMIHSFNPLPAPKYREIAVSSRKRFCRCTVSIRSLHRSTGRSPVVTVTRKSASLFQSAPCTEVQGDAWLGVKKSCADSFNPLPAPKYREITDAIRGMSLAKSFNPLPAPKYREIS